MGLEGGSAVANSVPDCLSFAKAQELAMGLEGGSAIANSVPEGIENTENPSKKAPKSLQNATLEAPGSFLGSILKKTQVPARKNHSF